MSPPARVKRTEPIPSREGRRARPKPSGKWCRGITGVLHQWKWVEDSRNYRSGQTLSEQRCERCRKKGGYLLSWLRRGEGTGWDPIRREYSPLQGPAFGGGVWVRE